MKRTILASTIISLFLVGCGGTEDELIDTINLPPIVTINETIFNITENSTLGVDISIVDPDDMNTQPLVEIVSSSDLVNATYSFETGVLEITTSEVVQDTEETITLTATDVNGSIDQVVLTINILDGEAVITEGVITGFGSVYVDGVEYETDDADVEVNDEESDESNLEVGMVIKLTGVARSNGVSGIASNIQFSDTVRGELESIDLENNTLVVMGQTITFNEETNFKGFVLEDLVSGNVVVVSGITNDEGVLVATLIIKKAESVNSDTNNVYRLKGEISDIDTETTTFMIGDIRVNYSNAEIEGLDEGETIKNGFKIKIKGTQVVLSELYGKTLVVDKIKVYKNVDKEIGRKFVFEGYVHEVDFDNNFLLINDHKIYFNQDTGFLLGNEELLSRGIKVGIKATQEDANYLVAQKIVFFHKPNVFIEGMVSDINSDEKHFSVADVKLFANGRTKFEDESESDIKYFSLDDVAVGDYLDVKGIKLTREDLTSDVLDFLNIVVDENTQEIVLATGVERQDAEKDEQGNNVVEMSGFLKILEDNTVVLLDKHLEFNDASEILFQDKAVSLELMIQKVKELNESGFNIKAKLKGILSSDSIIVTEIEFDENISDIKGFISITDNNELVVGDYILEFRNQEEIFINGQNVTLDELYSYITEYKDFEANIKVSIIGSKANGFFFVDKLRVVESEDVALSGIVYFNDDGKLVLDNKVLVLNDNSEIYINNNKSTIKQLLELVENSASDITVTLYGDLIENRIIIKKIKTSSDEEIFVKKIDGDFYINDEGEIVVSNTVIKLTESTEVFIDENVSSEENLRELILGNNQSLPSGYAMVYIMNDTTIAKKVYVNSNSAQITEIEGSLIINENNQLLIGDKVLSFIDDSVIKFDGELSSYEELVSLVKQKVKLKVFAEVKELINGIEVYTLNVIDAYADEFFETTGGITLSARGGILFDGVFLIFNDRSEIVINGEISKKEALVQSIDEFNKPDAILSADAFLREVPDGLIVRNIFVSTSN